MPTNLATLSVRIFDEIWNKQKLDVADELISPDFVVHDPNSVRKGLQEYKQFVREYLTAFPDAQFTIDNQVSDETMVATRWSCTGTHKGELLGIPATGRRVSLTGIVLSKVVGGKFVESWNSWDMLSMMQQLGVIASREVTQAA